MCEVLVVTERFWPEDFIINDLAAELAARGAGVTVLTQQPSYPQGRLFQGYRNRLLSRENWRGVRILRFRTVLGYRDSLPRKLCNYLWFALFGALVARFRLPRYDLVLIYQTGPLTMAVPGIVAAKARRKPVAIWTQDVWPDSVYAYGFRRTRLLARGLDAFVGWVYAKADAIMISCRGFSDILGRYTPKPLAYTPNWPLAPYRPAPVPARAPGVPVFLFAGNIGKVQNLENVLQGFARACRAEPGFARLRIVGDGSALDGLREQAAMAGVPVEFPGRRPAQDMGEEYDQADFLVLSLADEPVLRLTVPAKFQMYLSVGKPVLCAAGGEVSRQVRDGALGVVTDPRDPGDIARGFLAMRAAPPAQVAQWSANAAAALARDFDRNTIIGSIQQTLERLLGEGG